MRMRGLRPGRSPWLLGACVLSGGCRAFHNRAHRCSQPAPAHAAQPRRHACPAPFRNRPIRTMLADECAARRAASAGDATWPSSQTSSRPSATRRSCGSTGSRRAGVNLYVKIEAFNPLGSVKDRLALGVIEAAERKRRAQARPDRDRGDQRQHRHRPRHGVRREGLSAGRDHGRDASASSGAS